MARPSRSEGEFRYTERSRFPVVRCSCPSGVDSRFSGACLVCAPVKLGTSSPEVILRRVGCIQCPVVHSAQTVGPLRRWNPFCGDDPCPVAGVSSVAFGLSSAQVRVLPHLTVALVSSHNVINIYLILGTHDTQRAESSIPPIAEADNATFPFCRRMRLSLHRVSASPVLRGRLQSQLRVQQPCQRRYAFQAAGAPVYDVFNRKTKWLQRERAASDVETSRRADYLRDEVAGRLCERLLVSWNPHPSKIHVRRY